MTSRQKILREEDNGISLTTASRNLRTRQRQALQQVEVPGCHHITYETKQSLRNHATYVAPTHKTRRGLESVLCENQR